jgi:uncharacterized membrane protein YbhN (UPF0104 family)
MSTGSALGSPLPTARLAWRALRSAALLAGAAVLAYGIALVVFGSQATWEAVQRLGAADIALAAGVVACGFVLRYLRWALLLRGFGHRQPFGQGLRIYLAGLALTSSPGKVGETLRSVFLLRHGVALPQSLSAFVSDRLSDVIGVALLGAVAAAVAGQRIVTLELLTVAVLAGSFMLRAAARGSGWLALVARVGPWPVLGRPLGALLRGATVWALAWRPSRVPLYVAVAAAAYGVQALVFVHFTSSIALPIAVAEGIAIFASATLIGAASMVPAGLGVMEASLVLQLVQAGAAQDEALAVALLTRLVTFWFGLGVGALALLSLGLQPGAGTADSTREVADEDRA